MIDSEPERPISVADLAGAVRETLDIEGRVARNPYGMVAGALGIGFLLGGGLFTRFTARILGAGLRIGLMSALPMLQKEIVQAIGGSRVDQ